MERANKAVKIGYSAFMAQYPKATKRDVAQWADDALDEASGCAFWEFPPTPTVRNSLFRNIKPANWCIGSKSPWLSYI